jgi:hypothetical protein
MKDCVFALGLTLAGAIACGSPRPPLGTGGTGAGPEPVNNAFCTGTPSPSEVLRAKCATCHSDPPNSGARFKLTRYADAKERAWAIAALLEADLMPPAAVNTPLSGEQKAILLNWLDGGALGADCDGGPGCEDDPNLCAGERFLPCKPDVRIQAYARRNRSAKYTLPGGATNYYNCYQFANPLYGTDRLVTAEAPIIDNTNVVHHWLLFGSRTGADGQVDDRGNCFTPELTDTVLTGWAPGGTNQVYPNDVGVTMNEYPILTLQVHYNNPSSRSGADASGVAFCSTTEAKPNVAGIVALGTDLGLFIPGYASDHPGGVGTCSNLFKDSDSGTATIITSAPHMHKLGTGFTTEQIRDGERIAYVSNVPTGSWRFDGQTHYPHSEVSPGGSRILVEPGDQLITTCYYSNPSPFPVGFGGSTEAEMCYDFVVAYPIAQLRRGCGPWITFQQ